MFWGCGFFFGKIALAEMNSGAMVLYRFLFAALGLLPFLLTHRPNLNRREWLILLFASVLGVPLQFLFQFHGLALTTVSHAALMVGMMPVILAVGATLFAHERLHTLGWVALVVSTIGAALIALGGTHHAEANGPTLRGDLYVVLSLCISLFWVLLNQRLVMRHSAVVITAYGLCSGTVMLLFVVPPLYGMPPVHNVSLKAWLALAASGLLCTAILHAPLELGNDQGPGLTGCRPPQHGAPHRLAARHLRPARDSRPSGLARRRHDSAGRHRPHHPRPP